MPIPVTCPSCSTTLKVKDDLAGRSVKCPKCQTITKVPGEKVAKLTTAAVAAPPTEKIKPASAPRTTGKKPPPLQEDFEDEEPQRKPSKKKSLAVEFEVPDKYQEQIQEELSTGEKCTWVGQPARRVVFVRALVYPIGGVVLFVIAVIAVVAFSKGPIMFALAPFLFFIPALGLLLAPFYKLWMAGRTCYVLTNRRCIVWRCTWYGSVDMTNYNPAQLMNMRRQDMWFFGKGAGDLVFRSETTITTTYGQRGSNTSVSTKNFGFLSIERVRDIERLVRETLTDRLADRLVVD